MYRLELNSISRSGGKKGKRHAATVEHGFSATAAAAYRSGSIVTDRQTGEVHDYTRKRRIGHCEIVLPPGAPAWGANREMLWNAVEAAEVRKDARLAQEFIVALPHGLTAEQKIELVRDLAQSVADRHSLPVDFAIHQDDPKRWDGSIKDKVGDHAHLLMPTRALTPDGFSKAKCHALNDWKASPRTLRYWREKWAVIGNKHMQCAGLVERWDHRTLKVQREDALARGDIAAADAFDRLPGVHLGAASTALERDGISTYWGDQLRAILAQNGLRKLSREKKQIEASIAALERRLRELHDEQAAEDAADVCTKDGDDPRWAVFEDTFMRDAQAYGLSFGELTRALQAFRPQFSQVMDAVESQGWTPERLAQESAGKVLEADRQRMHAEAQRDEPPPQPEHGHAPDAPSL